MSTNDISNSLLIILTVKLSTSLFISIFLWFIKSDCCVFIASQRSNPLINWHGLFHSYIPSFGGILYIIKSNGENKIS